MTTTTPTLTTRAHLDALRPRFDSARTAIARAEDDGRDAPVEVLKALQRAGRTLDSMCGCIGRGRGPEVLGATWLQYEAEVLGGLASAEEWCATV